jgi:protein SCO1/2
MLHRFFATWRFPVFAFAVLFFATAFSGILLLIPGGDSGVGAFADEFRTWCFGYDSATGTYEWAYIVMLFLNPLVLSLLIVGLWWGPLKDLQHEGLRRGLPSAASGFVLILISASGFGLLGADSGAQARDLEFPADSLRTEIPAPEIDLVDQNGERVALQELRGGVVIVTGVYATCGYTCPMIMGQVKNVVDSLSPEEAEWVTVLAVTLDPAHDTPKVLKEMAANQGVSAPRYRLLTGDPATVERTLDLIGIKRKRDPETGVIDHANIFLVVDREGRVAYRFSLGDRQEEWLGEAIKKLVAEAPPAD